MAQIATQLVRATIASVVVARPEPTEERPQGMGLDKGDDDDDVRTTLRACGFTAHMRSRSAEAKEIAQSRQARTTLDGGAQPQVARSVLPPADTLGETA